MTAVCKQCKQPGKPGQAMIGSYCLSCATLTYKPPISSAMSTMGTAAKTTDVSMKDLLKTVSSLRAGQARAASSRLSRIMQTVPELGALAAVFARQPRQVDMTSAECSWLQKVMARDVPITTVMTEVGDTRLGVDPTLGSTYGSMYGTAIVVDDDLEDGTVRVHDGDDVRIVVVR